MYMVRNGKLERIDDKNRILHFLGLGNSEHAMLKVDYNAMNLTLVTNNVTPISILLVFMRKLKFWIYKIK